MNEETKKLLEIISTDERYMRFSDKEMSSGEINDLVIALAHDCNKNFMNFLDVNILEIVDYFEGNINNRANK